MIESLARLDAKGRLVLTKENAMADPEISIEYLENQIPALAQAAVTMAYWNTLASGQSVLETENGAIYEMFPDGTRRLIKQIEPPIQVQYGQKIALR